MKKHIVCFGDSNTHGFCGETQGTRFDENTRWTCLLQKKLGDEYLIIEEGLSGRTTCFEDPLEEGLSAIPYIYPCLKTHEPVDLLVIMLGTNDTKERFGVSSGCIAQGLGRLVDKAISCVNCWKGGIPNILIVTPQNIGRNYVNTWVSETMGRGCAEKSEGLALEYRKLAQLKNCHYMDANEVITVVPNEVDCMHLTAQAHAQLAEGMAAKIMEIFA